ncbi:MAG: N-acetylmuramoyl-L-alanine amidase CwlD [Syntrophomonadaceae bacterium]
MFLDRAVFISKYKTNLVLIALFLLTLGYATVKTSYHEDKMVLGYAVRNKVIVVDAGHGGKDPGAVRGNVKEKDITLSISKKLDRLLGQAGAVVIMTRETDTDLAGEDFRGTMRERKRKDLATRVDKANKAKADLYISIHANADVSPRWSGAQTFYCGSSEKSRCLAEAIQQELTRTLGNTKRKAKTGSYYISDNTEMTAVIVEVGFLSNPEEASLLTNDEYQNKVAQAIFSGIAKAEEQNQPATSWKMTP